MWNWNAINYRVAWIVAALLAAPGLNLADSVSREGGDEAAGNYHFGVEIEGRPIGGFISVSGLSAETEVVEYRSGSGDTLVRKLPGRLKFSNIVIRRPYVGDDVLHEWVWQTLTPGGVAERRDGAVIVHDRAGNEVVRYRFFGGWPCKWTGPGAHEGSLKLASEEVVICVDWFEEA